MILALISLLMAGIFKALLDRSSENNLGKNPFWNKGFSWQYKWKWVTLPDGRKIRKERFPLSSTILVAFTDGWHLIQLIMYRFIYLSIAIGITQKLWLVLTLVFLILPIIHSVPFEVVYKNINSWIDIS